MATGELTLDEFQNDCASTAWFLEGDPAEQQHVIYHGITEELEELLDHPSYRAEQSSMLLGFPVSVEPTIALRETAVKEAGDCLYYLAAGCMIHDTTLQDVADRMSPQVPITTFPAFDGLFKHAMAHDVPDGYSPDYLGMLFWNLPPYDGPPVEEITEVIGRPLTFTFDGRRVLAQTLRNTTEWLGVRGSFGSDHFMTDVAVSLAGMSTVLQNRFGSSLEEAAQSNIEKRARRKIRGTQTEGVDVDRSRKPGEPRPELSGFTSEMVSLAFAAQPVHLQAQR